MGARPIATTPLRLASMAQAATAIYSDTVHLSWFDPVLGGVADTADAWDAAIAALPNTGGTLIVRPGVYGVSRVINIGNGSSSAESTKNCIRIIVEAGSGVGEGESSTVAGAQIKYIGSNTTDPVLHVKGPMFGFQMENVVVNCNGGKAEIGIKLTHLWKAAIKNCSVQQYRTYSWYMESLDAALPSGVGYHFMECYFEKLHGLDPRERGTQPLNRPTANGLYVNGGRTNNIGFSRNVFVGCEFMYGGDTGTRGIWVGYLDSCSFTSVFTPQQDPGSYSAGNGVFFDDTCPNNFPLDNVFYACPLQGGVSGSGGFGNFFFPYPQSDSEPQPKNQYLRGFGVDMLFGWKTWNIATGSIDFTYSGNSDKSFARFTPVASGVNFPELKGSVTTAPAELNTLGDDTNVSLRITPKGNGGVQIYGTSATEALNIYSTTRTKYLTFQPETASGVASVGYWTGAAYGTIAFPGATTFSGAITVQTDNGLKFVNQTSAAAAQTGTLTNAPAAGNPGYWARTTIGGVNYAFPCWAV